MLSLHILNKRVKYSEYFHLITFLTFILFVVLVQYIEEKKIAGAYLYFLKDLKIQNLTVTSYTEFVIA